MSDARAFEWVVIAGLACLLAIAVRRGVALSRRGVRLFPIDRERTAAQVLLDLVFALGFLPFVVETLATAVPLGFHLAPEATRRAVLHNLPARVIAALAVGRRRRI